MANTKLVCSVVIVLVLTILVSVTHAQDAATEVCADPNETFDDCGPSCGDRTCANRSRNDAKCLRSCASGCFCKGGFVRNKSNRCIASYMCASMG
ncbi:putative TIL domain polypeptide [Anopheles sinensis]|uniref:Putative TIL domain polypeptide n=1 Tax=Anopheles sinensis TaxID=74873 RepID=A0A084WMU5_ANOSI|nr:putative TIL domain polypeptide [Anopheles sinensis]